MLNGLDLIECRPLNEQVDFSSIEAKFGIKIPPKLRVFTESFKWKTELTDGQDFYYYPKLSGGEVSFPFHSIEDNLNSTLNSSDEEILDRKLILFATNRFGFYVATLEGEMDKILTKTKSTEGFEVVAENVFEFLRGITNNLSDSANTEEEYRKFMIEMGYDEDELEDEISDWRNYKGL